MRSNLVIQPPKGYISINQFAVLIGKSRRTVYNILDKDDCPLWKREDGHYFIEKKSALQWKESHK